MVDAGADYGASGPPSVTFIVLSFARPANIQRIVDAILCAAPHYRVLVCNNQPNIDIGSYVRCDDARLDLIQRKEKWGPISRYHLARAASGELFVSIDDDVFLTPAQVNLLVGCLVADPARAHGVWGEIFQAEGDRMVIQSGIHGQTCDVSVLNCVYAFTRDHVERVFGFLRALGMESLKEVGPGDDILISRAATLPPVCHDLGAIEFCPSASQEGVARFRSQNFTARRARLWRRLQQLESVLDTPENGNEIESAALGSLDFRRHLLRINSIISGAVARGEGVFQCEGNLFYHHEIAYRVDAPPDASRMHKRKNLILALRGADAYLEVGFNAGHSALLALSLFPGLQYVGVDLHDHPYTKDCAAYLTEAFGRKFQLLSGDSRELLPLLAAQSKNHHLDLIHIDGGHDRETLRQDIENTLRLSDDYSRILVDDLNLPDIRTTIIDFLRAGRLRQSPPPPGWSGDEQALLAPNVGVV
jgi:hypothetical protein